MFVGIAKELLDIRDMRRQNVQVKFQTSLNRFVENSRNFLSSLKAAEKSASESSDVFVDNRNLKLVKDQILNLLRELTPTKVDWENFEEFKKRMDSLKLIHIQDNRNRVCILVAR